MSDKRRRQMASYTFYTLEKYDFRFEPGKARVLALNHLKRSVSSESPKKEIQNKTLKI
jgi:hypothetical protein